MLSGTTHRDISPHSFSLSSRSEPSLCPTPGRKKAVRRLLADGAPALSDAELLSVILRSAPEDCLMSARALRTLSNADRSSVELRLLTDDRWAVLQAALEIARRNLSACLERGQTLDDQTLVAEYLRARLRDLPYEVFGAIFLDTRNRVIDFKEIFRGTLDCCAVHPREIVRDAIHLNSQSVILFHNHPSGSAEVSTADRLTTARLVSALALIDVGVLDHFVVGDTVVTSFASMGLL